MDKQFDNASVVVTFRATPEENEALVQAAKLSGRSRADVMRRLACLVNTSAGRAILGIVTETTPAVNEWVKGE
jgi:hypothetical protein